MRVIGAAGMSGRHFWPLIIISGGGEEQVMLVAGREKVPFHAMPDRSNPCLALQIGQSQFRIVRDKENGAILAGQRSTEMYLSYTRSFEHLVFFPLSIYATETISVSPHCQKTSGTVEITLFLYD